jgi:hypothetical protein
LSTQRSSDGSFTIQSLPYPRSWDQRIRTVSSERVVADPSVSPIRPLLVG